MATTIPRLETERLVLRGWRDEDLDAYASICADPEVMRFVGGVQDRAATWRAMALYLGHWWLRGYGLWAVESRDGGALLGRVGLWRPEGWPGLELGWTLARKAWGHGYATEGARAALGWAWGELGLTEVISVIDPRNVRSVAVAGRLGMQHDRDWDLMGRRVRIYSLRRG